MRQTDKISIDDLQWQDVFDRDTAIHNLLVDSYVNGVPDTTHDMWLDQYGVHFEEVFKLVKRLPDGKLYIDISSL